MAVTPEVTTKTGSRVALPRPSFADTLAVYLKRRVLIVMFLGFSSGLPLALSGGTLLVWMTESGVNLGTIGLFALVGTPYTIKFLWAPLIDALDVPLLSRRFGRRRGLVAVSAASGVAAMRRYSPASSLRVIGAVITFDSAGVRISTSTC